MNTWTTAIIALLLLWLLGGIVGIFMVAKSLGKNIIAISRHGLGKSDVNAIIRKGIFVYLLTFMVSLLPWTAVISTIGSMVDQYFRNTVNNWMNEPDLFSSISISPAEYATLPNYWRQALAEIDLRPKETAADVKGLISDLTVKDIKLINSILPYWTSIGIIRDRNSKSTAHPMPELSYPDLEHLESLGVLQNVASGAKQIVRQQDRITGKTINLVIRFYKGDAGIDLMITPFTKGGRELVEAFQVPSSISYFEWIAKALEENGAEIELFVTSNENNNGWGLPQMQGQIRRDSIPPWPPGR